MANRKKRSFFRNRGSAPMQSYNSRGNISWFMRLLIQKAAMRRKEILRRRFS